MATYAPPNSLQAADALGPRDALNVLVAEYKGIKGELRTYIELFHRQSHFVTVYVSTIAGAASLAATWWSRSGQLPALFVAERALPWPFLGETVTIAQVLGFFVYSLLASVGFYFMAATQSYIYVIEILARRGAVVEQQVNKLLGEQVMAWEIVTSPRFIRGFVRRGFWVGPSLVRMAWSLLVFCIVLSMQAFTAPQVMGHGLSRIFLVFASLGLLFSLAQIISQQITGIPFIGAQLASDTDAARVASALANRR